MFASITQGIAYFLAGSFLVGTIFSRQPANGTLQPLDWLAVSVGSVLILAGFSFILSVYPLRRIGDYLKRSEPYLLPLLFAITITEVVILLFDFHEIKPLFIATSIFIIFVLITIIFTSKFVFTNVFSLIELSLIFNALAIILLLAGAEKIQIIIILILSFALLILAITKLDKQK
jgi:hypothetical protein